MSKWKLRLTAEPIVPSWNSENECCVSGSELQRVILRAFDSENANQVGFTKEHKEFTFEKTFTFKEHGEFFRGALTMAALRYAGDFFDLLQRYGKIKVTISKFCEIPKDGAGRQS